MSPGDRTGEPLWASERGDHRGAMRSPALGPTRGRVRWRRRPGGRILGVPVVDAAGYVWIACESPARQPALVVLSSSGDIVAQQPLDPALHPSPDPGARDGRWPFALGLTQSGLWLVGERCVDLRGAGGEVRARLPIPRKDVVATSLTPEGDLAIWRREDHFCFRLERVGHGGAPRWSVPLPFKGYIYRSAIACDDQGTLYVAGEGRIGDGVSGDDIPTGGLTIVSPSGEVVFTRERGRERGRARHRAANLAAGERSAVLGDRAQIEIDALGATLREASLCGDDEDAVRFDSMEMRLSPRARLLNPAVLLAFYGTVTQVYSPVTDAAGQRYVVLSRLMSKAKPCLVSLGLDDSIAFRMEEPDEGAFAGAMIMGPARTLLFARGDEILAIE